MKILGTGLTGLVGSRIVEILGHKYEFENLSLETGIDITDRKRVVSKIRSSKAPLVLHLAAKTDVDGCEKDKVLDKKGEAWLVNVEGTKNIADNCARIGKKLIYISTDFVFDGENPPTGGYKEENIPNPVNWYGRTKYEGEKIVKSLGSSWLIVRIAYPYRANFERNDFVRTIISRLVANQEMSVVTDHVFTPTFVDDVAYALDLLIRRDVEGIFHVVGDQFLTPHKATLIIAERLGLDTLLIKKTTREKYFKNRAPRPFNLSLKNDKIKKLGVKMKTFEEGIEEIKKQLSQSS